MQTVPNDFWEWLGSLGGDVQSLMLFSSLLFGAIVISIIAGTIYKMHKNRLDDALKRELLERGMSADEIATVMSAARPKCGSHPPRQV